MNRTAEKRRVSRRKDNQRIHKLEKWKGFDMNTLCGAATVALRMKTMWQASPWDQRAGGKRRCGGLSQPSLGW